MPKEKERMEILMRVLVLIVSGIILGLWKAVIQIVWVVNIIYTLIKGKRNKTMGDFCEIWSTQVYIFLRYILLQTNERPFPFNNLTKNMTKFQK